MIKLLFGGLGSGKTVCAIKEAVDNPQKIITYSNIEASLPYYEKIKGSMIIKKTWVGTTKKRSGEIKESFKLEFNKDFWKELADQKLNVVIDEAHLLLNPRRSMSQTNIIMGDFLAMLRRIIGSREDYGELTLITQLPNRLDLLAKEMATEVRHHVCHYKKSCLDCGFFVTENNESPEKIKLCFSCGSLNLKRENFQIEVYHFINMRAYDDWKFFGNNKLAYRHYLVPDIENYFKYYNTHSWEDILSEFY